MRIPTQPAAAGQLNHPSSAPIGKSNFVAWLPPVSPCGNSPRPSELDRLPRTAASVRKFRYLQRKVHRYDIIAVCA